MNSTAPLTSSLTLADNLNRLVALRWFIILACALLLLLANANIELVDNSATAWLILFVYALANSRVWWWLRRQQRLGIGINEWSFVANLVLDLLLIWLFLSFSGGSANPFTLLFLLPVIVAAATLRLAAIWLLTGLSTGAYMLLFWLTPVTHVQHATQNSLNLHLLGMLLGLIFSAALVAYFVTGMGRALREREVQLATIREQALRDERVIALGAMAAGAAHELGTPLATMTLLVDELELKPDSGKTDPGKSDEKRQQLRLLKSQIRHCKHILSGLSLYGREAHPEAGQTMTLRQLMDTLLQRWQQLRPSASLRLQWLGYIPEVKLVVDETLFQSLCSLLNNAADASSSDAIELSARHEGESLILDITDHGEGIDSSVAAKLGRVRISGDADKPGLGIGLLLASSVIERQGGRVTHRSAGSGDGYGGTIMSVSLPVKSQSYEHTVWNPPHA